MKKIISVLLIALLSTSVFSTAFAATDFTFTLQSRAGGNGAFVHSERYNDNYPGKATKTTTKKYGSVKISSSTPKLKKNTMTCLVLYYKSGQASDTIWYPITSTSHKPTKYLSGMGRVNSPYHVAMRLNTDEPGSGSIDVYGAFNLDSSLTY